MGEDPGAPVGGQTHQEGHHGFLAHIRGPKDEGRKEEDRVPVAATTRPAERSGEGEVKEDDADEGEPAEDQEGTEVVDPDDRRQELIVALVDSSGYRRTSLRLDEIRSFLRRYVLGTQFRFHEKEHWD